MNKTLIYIDFFYPEPLVSQQGISQKISGLGIKDVAVQKKKFRQTSIFCEIQGNFFNKGKTRAYVRDFN